MSAQAWGLFGPHGGVPTARRIPSKRAISNYCQNEQHILPESFRKSPNREIIDHFLPPCRSIILATKTFKTRPPPRSWNGSQDIHTGPSLLLFTRSFRCLSYVDSKLESFSSPATSRRIPWLSFRVASHEGPSTKRWRKQGPRRLREDQRLTRSIFTAFYEPDLLGISNLPQRLWAKSTSHGKAEWCQQASWPAARRGPV